MSIPMSRSEKYSIYLHRHIDTHEHNLNYYQKLTDLHKERKRKIEGKKVYHKP